MPRDKACYLLYSALFVWPRRLQSATSERRSSPYIRSVCACIECLIFVFDFQPNGMVAVTFDMVLSDIIRVGASFDVVVVTTLSSAYTDVFIKTCFLFFIFVDFI